MRNSEKLTVVLDPETRNALREWAYEDGGRSLCSLLRKIVAKSLAERRRPQTDAQVTL